VAVNSGKADQLEEGYKKLGFTVRKEELPTFEGEADSEGSEGNEGSETGSESGSDDAMEDVRSP
jgi:hypothetical protein